jgi:hypothetical protein
MVPTEAFITPDHLLPIVNVGAATSARNYFAFFSCNE